MRTLYPALITLTLLTIINGIGAGPTMWLYAAFNVAAWVFVFLRMPEDSPIVDAAKGTGFVEYNSETLYVRPVTVPNFPHVPLEGLRQKSSVDDHALFRMGMRQIRGLHSR